MKRSDLQTVKTTYLRVAFFIPFNSKWVLTESPNILYLFG